MEFFDFNRNKDERINKIISNENIIIDKLGYETWLGADISFERQPDYSWDITIYRRIQGTPVEVPLLLACLVSISRRTKAWYKSSDKPFDIEVKDLLLELNIKNEKDVEVAEETLYSINHGVNYAFETLYALEKGNLEVAEVLDLSKHYQQYSFSLELAIQFLASMAALRKAGGSVNYFNDLLIKRKRYDMLQIVDCFETCLEEQKIDFSEVKKAFKILHSDIDKMEKDINDVSNDVLNNGNVGVKYHIALSFAGEDRGIAERIAYELKESNYSVFYDDYAKAELWGKDLYVHLNDLYSKQAKYCLMIISKHYKEKLWTNHERRAAQTKAFLQNEEYILPLRLDDTEIPGLNATIGYIDYNKIDFPELISVIKRRINM